MSESSKLAQKEYKSRHDGAGKMIHWELCKKFEFDHTDKWYIQNPESVIENKTHKILWDFEIQMTRPSDSKKTPPFTVPSDRGVKLKESEKWEKYLDLARKLKKLWNMRVTVIPIVICSLTTVIKGLVHGLEDLEIKGWVETIKITALSRLSTVETYRQDLSMSGPVLALWHINHYWLFNAESCSCISIKYICYQEIFKNHFKMSLSLFYLHTVKVTIIAI